MHSLSGGTPGRGAGVEGHGAPWASMEEGVPDGPSVPEQEAPQPQAEPEPAPETAPEPAPKPEPEPGKGGPDFGAGLPDEVLRRLLLACSLDSPALALARCAAVHPAWRQVARRLPGCVLAAFGATGSIVEWVVPEGVESVGIEACGAQGGGKSSHYSMQGGRGARVVCRAVVRPGERLAVLVGQAGGTAEGSGGGGGGSFVVRAADGSPLAVAGGGGGAGGEGAGGDAALGEAGARGFDGSGQPSGRPSVNRFGGGPRKQREQGSGGGSQGGGGLGDGWYPQPGRHAGGSGGGLAGDGVALRPGKDPTTERGVGRCFANGGAGGTGPGQFGEGGFGGGGYGSLAKAGGGGGGYSGGGGGGCMRGGGGGGCWAPGGVGRAELRTEGGDGRVTITILLKAGVYV